MFDIHIRQFFGAAKCPKSRRSTHVEPGVLRFGNYTRSRELQCNDYGMQRISFESKLEDESCGDFRFENEILLYYPQTTITPKNRWLEDDFAFGKISWLLGGTVF